MRRPIFVVLLLAAAALALEPEAAKEAASRVDATRIGATVAALCVPEMQGRKTGTAGAKKATSWLAKAFEESGLQKLEGQSSYVVATESGDENVLGRVPGGDKAAEAIVVSAHWDSIGEDETGKLVPGADENASGLAALVETAHALAKTKPRRTIVFAAFGGWWDKEDPKRFRGAKEFVKKFPKLRPIFQVDLMMLGLPLIPAQPERFFALGTEYSQGAVEALKASASAVSELKLARASIDLSEKRGPRSDYDAFRAAGVPFVFLTSGVSKHYHKPTDEPSTIDPKRIASASRLAIAVVARIDSLDAAPDFTKEPARDDRLDATEVLGLIEAALDPKSKISMTATEQKALTFKRDKIKDLLAEEGELHFEVRERGVLKDSLELLLVCLTK